MDKGDKKLLIWWGVLVALTILSFESSWLTSKGAIAVSLVIGIALFKVRIVILHFMEVAEAPLFLRAAFEVWTVAIGLLILGFWFGLVS